MPTVLAAISVRTFDWLDYAIFGAYFVVNLGVGWWWARKRPSSDGFLRGERKIKWWAAGISFYATATTSISFMAVPAKSYATDWRFIGSAPAQAAATLLVAFVFVALLRRLNITTVFEYLEMRYDHSVRLLGAVLSLLLKVFGRMSVVMLLPSMALTSVTGLDVYRSIAVLGGATITYAMLGGFVAVIWTDVFQFTVMFGGVALALTYIVGAVPDGLAGIWRIGMEHGKLNAISWELDITQPTVWVFMGLMLRTVFMQLSDQSLMQRVFSTPDVRSARRTVALGAFLGLPGSILFFFVGTALFAFYQTHSPHPASLPNDAIFPFFIVNELPRGVVGLVIAGLFASAMGALSSDLNSSATIVVTDLLPLVRKHPTETLRLLVARSATVAAGVAAALMAAYLASLNVDSLWDQILKLAALIGGGIPGIFALGLLTRRANASGVIVGALTSIGVTGWIQTATAVNVFFQGFCAVVTCMIVGYVVSLCFPSAGRQRDLRGLTIWDPCEPPPQAIKSRGA